MIIRSTSTLTPILTALVTTLALLAPAAHARKQDVPAAAIAAPGEEVGTAVVYSKVFQGRVTAGGSRFDVNKLTAAHKTMPFGTKVRVTNTKNGKSTVVTITDRGPTQPDRIIDLTPRAAKALGIHTRGSGTVKLTVVK
jgi:rare lipoprotein A